MAFLAADILQRERTGVALRTTLKRLHKLQTTLVPSEGVLRGNCDLLIGCDLYSVRRVKGWFTKGVPHWGIGQRKLTDHTLGPSGDTHNHCRGACCDFLGTGLPYCIIHRTGILDRERTGVILRTTFE